MEDPQTPPSTLARACVDDLTGAACARSIREIVSSGNGRESVRELLAQVPGARAAVLASVFECLDAEKTMYDRNEKRMIQEVDGKVRLSAAALILSYAEGLPVQQILNLHANANGQGKGEKTATPAMTPELLDALEADIRREREKLKGKTGG